MTALVLWPGMNSPALVRPTSPEQHVKSLCGAIEDHVQKMTCVKTSLEDTHVWNVHYSSVLYHTSFVVCYYVLLVDRDGPNPTVGSDRTLAVWAFSSRSGVCLFAPLFWEIWKSYIEAVILPLLYIYDSFQLSIVTKEAVGVSTCRAPSNV